MILEKNSSILARPSLAEHSWSKPAPVAVKAQISEKFVSKCQARSQGLPAFYASETPIFLKKTVGTFLG
jgi:hypothetical protein